MYFTLLSAEPKPAVPVCHQIVTQPGGSVIEQGLLPVLSPTMLNNWFLVAVEPKLFLPNLQQ